MAGTGMMLCQVDSEDVEDTRRRQFIHCEWAPDGTEGYDDDGVIGTVGLSDDRGYFQLLRLGKNDSTFFRVSTNHKDFPPRDDGSPGHAWDSRPWSQFGFVPGGRGAVVFLQWQSNTVLWARLSRRTAQPVARLGGHEQRVRVVCVDKAGEYAASGSDDGAVKLWRMASLSAAGAHEAAHTGAVTALHFLGGNLFSAGSDQRVCSWDVASGAAVAEFRTHASPLLDLTSSTAAASGDGSELFGGHADGTVSVWSLDTQSLVRSVPSQTGTCAVLSVAAAPAGDLVAVGQLDGTLSAHKGGAEGPAMAGELIGNCELASAVVCVGFQPAGQRGVEDGVNHQLLCVCCREGVQFWSTAHLLSRISHPLQDAADTHDQQLDPAFEAARKDAVGRSPPPTPTRPEERPPQPIPTPQPTPERDEALPEAVGAELGSAADDEQAQQPEEGDEASQDYGHEAGVQQTQEQEFEQEEEQGQEQEQEQEGLVGPEEHAGNGNASAAPHAASEPATPVATPDRADPYLDYGAAALAARRAKALATESVPGPALVPPAEANYGDPVAFASVLVSNQNHKSAEAEMSAEEVAEPSLRQPQLHSTARLAARLEAVKQEKLPAEAAAAARAAAKPRSLVDFALHERKYGCLTSVEAEPEGPTTDLPPVQKAIDAQWERLRAMELRPDVQALFTPDREVEHLAPSGTRARLREGMATGAVSPNKGGATSPNKSGGPASLRSQFGTPYIFD